MKIVIRVLIVLLLLLSGASLYLGIRLFMQREQLKARTHFLENALVDVSGFVESEPAEDVATRDLPVVSLGKQELKQYYKLDPATGEPEVKVDPRTGKKTKVTTGPDTMSEVIKTFVEHARRQYVRLDETRSTLVDTREELADTQTAHRETKVQLTRERTRGAGLEDDKEALNDRVVDLQINVDNKDAQITELAGEVEIRNDTIAKLENRSSDLNDKIGAQDKFIDDLRHRIRQLEGKRTMGTAMSAGSKGKIIRVNPEWNFVVMTVDADSNLSRDTVLVIQRGSKFVGKVRVREIRDEQNVVIADIMNEWLQMPIQKGDRVLYALY